MNSDRLEERLRGALATRAESFSASPDAWQHIQEKAARTARPRLRGTGWLARHSSFLIPATAAAAVVAIAIAAATVGTSLTSGRASHHLGPAGPATPTPALGRTAPKPPQQDYLAVRDVPPVTPFVPLRFAADHATVWDFLWFGYVPQDTAAGIALCQLNRGGFYDGYSGCTSGALPHGTLARQTSTDGSGWIRVGVAAARVTSVRAMLPGGRVVTGTVLSVRGVPDKVWAVSYDISAAARIVFGDAAGRQVTQLNEPSGDISMPPRPSSGGIGIYKYKGQWVTAYLLRGGVVGYWWGDGSSSLSGQPVSQAPLGITESIDGSGYLSGYAPADAARVTIRLRNGKDYSSATKAGWPGSGISLWGPVGPLTRVPDSLDTIMITYDAAGHVLQEEPLIFLG